MSDPIVRRATCAALAYFVVAELALLAGVHPLAVFIFVCVCQAVIIAWAYNAARRRVQ